MIWLSLLLSAGWLFIAANLLGSSASAQALDEPQAWITPRTTTLALEAGATASRTFTLYNLSDEDSLFYAFRGMAGSEAPAKAGPQGTGYQWSDSREPRGPAFAWFDIEGSGTPLSLGADDAAQVSLPFSFPFYGVAQREVTISANGYLSFGIAGQTVFNQTIPRPIRPNAIIAPYWDDLNPASGGRIHYFHDAARQRFIVQYTNVPLQETRFSLARNTFQVILSADGEIQFQYLNVDTGFGSTIGLEDDLGTAGVQLAYNEPFLENALSIVFKPTPALVNISPASGGIAPGQSRIITMTIDAAEAEAGIYAHNLLLATSSPTQPLLHLSNRIEIGQEVFPFVITPGLLKAELDRGESVQKTILIENTDAFQAASFRINIRGATIGTAAAASPDTAGKTTGIAPVAEPTPVATMLLDPSLKGPGMLATIDLEAPQQLATSVAAPTSYAGEFAYGEPNLYYLLTAFDHQLQTVDYITGRRSVIGTLTPDHNDELWTGLAVDPTDGTLYGATTHDGSSTSYLYQIDPATVTARLIGAVPNAPRLAAIAVDNNGQLYGIETMHDVLLAIDKYSGTSEVVASLGFAATSVAMQGLDVDPATGIMYLAGFTQTTGTTGTSELRTVDTATGMTTLVSSYADGVPMGYLAMPSGSFLTPSIFSGNVPPGTTLALDVIFDATNLLAGTYNAAVRIEAADRAGSPETAVAAQLIVRGAPQIALTDLRPVFTFGPRFIGHGSETSLDLSNVGFSDLVIDRITSNLPDFLLSEASQADLPIHLGPGERHSFRVAFAPTQRGPIEGSLTIFSSDPATPELRVSTSGLGLTPPVIGPDTLRIRAVAGRSRQESIVIENPGTAQLRFSLMEHTENLADATTPPVLSEDFEQGIPASWMVIDHAKTGVQWMRHTAFQGLDYLNYTGGSGLAAMMSSHAQPGVRFDAELRTPLLHATAKNLVLHFRANFIDQAFRQDLLDLDISLDGGTTWSQIERWEEDLGSTFATPGEQLSFALGAFVDPGDMFMLRWRYFDTGFQPATFYAQIDEVRIVAEPNVLSFAEELPLLLPQSTTEIPLLIDADGLVPGVYEASLSVRINTPASLTQIIPIVLEVTSGVTVRMPSLNVHPNEVFEVPIQVQGPDPVATFEFAVDFDPTLLEIVGIATDSTLTEGAFLDITTEVPGQLAVATQSTLASSAPEGSLLRIQFRAREHLGETVFTFPTFEVNEGVFSTLTPEDSRIAVVPLYGDVDLDLTISTRDTGLLAQFIARQTDLKAASKAAADVSGNNGVSSNDLSLLRRFISGEIPCLPVMPACTFSSGSYTAIVQTQNAAKTDDSTPIQFDLAPNYPNPVYGTTTIAYTLPEAASTLLIIYNTLGQPVRHLAEGQTDAGHHTVNWDGRNDAGQPVASGVYLYKLQAGQHVQTRRMMVVR